MAYGQNDRMAGGVPVWNKFSSFVENITQKAENSDDSSFGISDVIDMINPLQHIPVVSSLYQSTTGDTIGSIAKIVGGALFGGPIGAVASIASVAYQSAKNNTDIPYPIHHNAIDLANMRAGFKPYNV